VKHGLLVLGSGVLAALLAACAPLAAERAPGEAPTARAPGPAPAPGTPAPSPKPRAPSPAPQPDRRAEPERDQKWVLVWADEFDGAACPDPANWRFERGFVRNEELQWYRPENASCRNGVLVIEARRETVANPGYVPGSKDRRANRRAAEYTSASLTTEQLQEWRYGRIDVRARIEPRYGLWPAIWTLGGVWPRSHGEVDIMEHFGRRSVVALHWAGGDRAKSIDSVASANPAWSRQFHVWRMEWTPDRIDISVDGQQAASFDITGIRNPDGANPFRQPHHLRLNLAVGGASGNPASTSFPARMEVDYVRVYRERLAGD
jgi:beta-glucanase (GH16 family)